MKMTVQQCIKLIENKNEKYKILFTKRKQFDQTNRISIVTTIQLN